MSIRHPTFAISHYARLASLIDIPQIIGAGFKSTLGEVGLNHFREETAVLEFFERDPFHPDLFFVVFTAWPDTVRVRQLAAKDVFHLMKSAVSMAEFMILANIFPHVEQFTHFNFGADLFQALPFEALAERFAVALAATGEYVEDAGLITHLDRE